MSHLQYTYIITSLTIIQNIRTSECGSGLMSSNFWSNLEFHRNPIGIHHLAHTFTSLYLPCTASCLLTPTWRTSETHTHHQSISLVPIQWYDPTEFVPTVCPFLASPSPAFYHVHYVFPIPFCVCLQVLPVTFRQSLAGLTWGFVLQGSPCKCCQ